MYKEYAGELNDWPRIGGMWGYIREKIIKKAYHFWWLLVQRLITFQREDRIKRLLDASLGSHIMVHIQQSAKSEPNSILISHSYFVFATSNMDLDWYERRL